MQNLKYDLSLDDYYIITKHLKKTKSDLMYEDYHFYINTYCKNKKCSWIDAWEDWWDIIDKAIIEDSKIKKYLDSYPSLL